ncbi:MAG: Tol-Pal system protein TolB [Parachlamydia sp.]|nr:Tol-Pal system protein TolB [Parachlamydia sp.]
MISKLVILILCMGAPLLAVEDKEPIVVRLETEARLLPLYASHWIRENPGFEAAYLDKLEKVLRFDLGHNGATALLPINGENETLASKGPFDHLSSPETWQAQRIYYVVKAKVSDKKLSLRLMTVNANANRAVDALPLTGDLAQDRRKIHKLADTIHKELFGKEGIASTRFIYTVKYQDTSKKWVSDVWEADYDGGNPRQVTRAMGLTVTPACIPAESGKSSGSFLYVSYLNGQPKIYIGSCNSQDGSSKRLTLMRGNQLMPTVSKQRDKIAFVSDITGNPDLFIQPFSPESGAIGKPQQIFAAYKATQGTPTFSPDGKQIAFVSNKDGSARIYIITIPAPGASLKGIKALLISKQNRESTAPAWSPDGTKLAYCAMTNGVRQIWIYDFDKKEERQITQGQGNKENPAWAPNSLHLIYNSTGNSGSELFLINLNQPQAAKISSGSGEKRFPNWGS